MPTLESTDEKITPKSILRHRPIGDGTPPTGKRSVVTSAATPTVQRASRLRAADSRDDVAEWKHVAHEEQKELPITPRPTATLPTVRRRVNTNSRPVVPSRSKLGFIPHLRSLQHNTHHPLFYLGMGMVAMLLLWTILSAVFGWLGNTINDIRYGRPRTFQTDAWVGHNEQSGTPSHFMAINLNRHIEIIEMPGGDAAHARIYVGPQLYGANDDLAPVTLSFVDVNGDHKPDMVITFQGSRIVYINDQGGFRPLLPSERAQAEKFLQHYGQ